MKNRFLFLFCSWYTYILYSFSISYSLSESLLKDRNSVGFRKKSEKKSLGVPFAVCQRAICRYGVSSCSSQFVLKSIHTHFGQFVLSFRSIRTHLIKLSQLVLILVDSYSVWSIRTHAKHMILMIYIILLKIDR